MNNFKKRILKILSTPHINLKKNYKLYRKVIAFFNPPLKEPYQSLDHRIIIKGREIPIRAFFPDDLKYSKVLVFFHGGGWVTGNIDTYTRVCANMANQTNCLVVSVDYLLAPENPFPAGLEDCYWVAKEILDNPHIINCKKEDIILIGDSAGGNLAAAVSLMKRDRNEFIPTKQILIYPATNYDHSENSPYKSVVENGTNYMLTSKKIQDYLDLYAPNLEDRKSPYVAPILSTDLSNQPDTLIITAEYDPLRDEGEAYGEKLKEFNNYAEVHRMPEAIHGFFTSALAANHIEKSYEIINNFIYK